MDDVKSIAQEFDALFSEDNYPKEFLKNYDLIECLASRNGHETLLVQKKDDEKKAIASCYDYSVYPFGADIGVLGIPEAQGLPRYYGKYENDRMVCVVREYVEGVTLREYVADRQLPLREILDKAKQLCDILEILHTHKPQVVHRDIKPENIIVKSDGSIALIDFDIARTVKEGGETDTVFFGTKVYAPPEQYGFGQTDSRADIYSFGVLLRWMVTGSARKNANISAGPEIETVIERCTAFSPDERYNDITEVKKALSGVRPGKKHINVGKALICAVAAVFMFTAGFLLGRITDTGIRQENISFREPLIEQAVRTTIGKGSGTLSKDDVLKATRLYIYGDRVFDGPEEFATCDVATSTEGTIHTLDDIKMLTNLSELHIIHQGYVDASGIAGHAKLTVVELKHMRLSNAQAVADAPNLREAVLFCDGLADVTAFENCPWLETLDIGLNDICNLDSVGRYPNVRNLGLMWLEMDNVDDIDERFPKLKSVLLQHGKIKDLSGLKKLKNLESVGVLREQAEEVRKLFEGTDVKISISEN